MFAADFIPSRLNTSIDVNNWPYSNIFSTFLCLEGFSIDNFENLINRGRRFLGKIKLLNTTLK